MVHGGVCLEKEAPCLVDALDHAAQAYDLGVLPEIGHLHLKALGSATSSESITAINSPFAIPSASFLAPPIPVLGRLINRIRSSCLAYRSRIAREPSVEPLSMMINSKSPRFGPGWSRRPRRHSAPYCIRAYTLKRKDCSLAWLRWRETGESGKSHWAVLTHKTRRQRSWTGAAGQ